MELGVVKPVTFVGCSSVVCLLSSVGSSVGGFIVVFGDVFLWMLER